MKRHALVTTLAGLVLLADFGFAAEVLRPTEKPVDRLGWKDSAGRFFWKNMYEEQLAAIRASKGRFDFVLVGDSITRNWATEKGRSCFGGDRRLGRIVARELFSDLSWLNAGIGGDGVSQVLWRCEHGILDGYTTPLVALMVGTNNRRDSAEDVALGIRRILALIRAKQPQAKILLSPILPRFPREDDPGDMNAKNEKTNEIIRRFCDGKTVVWFDWRAGLHAQNGELDKSLWYDREHPAEGGYRLWAKALLREVLPNVEATRRAAQPVALAPQGGGTLRFAGAKDAFSVVGFDYGTTRFADWNEKPLGLWRLRFRAGAAGEERILDALSFATATAAKTATGCRFSWKGLDLEAGDAAVDVTCDVDWRAAKGRYEFRIAVANRSRKYGLFDTEYPRLPRLVENGKGSVILPGNNWGGQRLRRLWGPAELTYPDYHAPVQLMMFEPDAGGGVLFAALDRAGGVKFVKCELDFSASFRVPAVGAGVPGSAGAPDFAFALYPYGGDWWQGAKHYRAWAAEESNWLRKGPIAGRRDFAPRLKDGGFWFLASRRGPVAENVTNVERVIERVAGRVPVSVHWYNWHKHPFDTLYPDYFPAKDGFGEAARRLAAKGVLVMPYVNGRLWDRADPAFERVKDSACQQTNGVPYVETWNKRDFSAMCQGTAFWRDKMTDAADRLIGDCGVNGIYYDQIASMKAVVCYSARHGHTVGGGSHWVDGYCRLVQTARDRHPGVPFTSENFSEPYIGVFDGFLTWSPNRESDVPLIPAIYSGYATTFSCRISPSYTKEAVRAALGRAFLWGGQGGWETDWILENRYRDVFEYIVRLAELRRGAIGFFTEGELLGEVKSVRPVPTLNLKWDLWGKLVDVKLPAVQATRWRSPAGAEMIAVANYADKPQVFDGGAEGPALTLAPGEIRLVRPGTATAGRGSRSAPATSPRGTTSGPTSSSSTTPRRTR